MEGKETDLKTPQSEKAGSSKHTKTVQSKEQQSVTKTPTKAPKTPAHERFKHLRGESTKKPDTKVQETEKLDSKVERTKKLDTKAEESAVKTPAQTRKTPAFQRFQHLREESLKKQETPMKQKTEKPETKEQETVTKSPTKSKKAPAYERFQHLKIPVPPTLSLPPKYKILEEMFKSADIVVRMLYTRSETCTFAKLKAAVQKMISK